MGSKSQRFFCNQIIMLCNKLTTIAMGCTCGSVSS